MVVIGETITYVGRVIRTGARVVILTGSTFSDSCRPSSNKRVRTAIRGWPIRGSGIVTTNVGPVRKVPTYLLYT